MAFPFTIKYSRTLNQRFRPESYPSVLTCIEKYINQKQVKAVVVTDNQLSFKSAVIGRYGVMVPIKKGVFNLIPKSKNGETLLTYQIYIDSILLILMAIGLIGILIFQFIGPVVFVLVGGINYLSAVLRHSILLNEIVEEINKG